MKKCSSKAINFNPNLITYDLSVVVLFVNCKASLLEIVVYLDLNIRHHWVRQTITLHGLGQTDRWIRIRRTMPLRRPNSENSLLYIINAVRKRSCIKDVYLKEGSRNTIPQVLPLTDLYFEYAGQRGECQKISHLGWRPSWMASYTLF